jgi:hypothetical protein
LVVPLAVSGGVVIVKLVCGGAGGGFKCSVPVAASGGVVIVKLVGGGAGGAL